MRVLLTGGAGYVGSHAAWAMHRSGHEIWVYDNLSEGHRQAVPEDRLIISDLMDGAKLKATLRDHQIEAVLHFAALTNVGISVTNPAEFYQNNIVGTLSLLDAMRTANVDRLVFSSTCATYGIPTQVPITETEKQAPINPYGFTKLAIEHALADYSHAYGLGYAALRYFNASGASAESPIGEDHDPETHLIPLVLQVALGLREHIKIFGNDYPTPDGTCVRDYIHVDDLAMAHIRALEHLTPGSQLKLNLGTGQGVSVMQVVEACRQVTGHPIPTKIVGRRKGDTPELIANATLANQTLNWQPKHTDIKSIVATAWQWHQQHPNGFSN